jgi:hypothetical protein
VITAEATANGTSRTKIQRQLPVSTTAPPTRGRASEAERGDRGPDAERAAALLGWEGVTEDRERDGVDRGGAETLQHARPDQHADVRRERGRDRGSRERDQPSEVDALAPERVAEPAGDDDCAGERQRIAVDHPLELGEGRAEIALHVGEPQVDDREVEVDREQRQRHRQQHPGAPRHARSGSDANGRRLRRGRRSALEACPLDVHARE